MKLNDVTVAATALTRLIERNAPEYMVEAAQKRFEEKLAIYINQQIDIRLNLESIENMIKETLEKQDHRERGF